MGAILEVAYYNTFILAGGGTSSPEPGRYHVEESRIKGGFNEKSVDLGVKAYIVDDEYGMRTRENAMIHSGVFNSKTKVNDTNQFPTGKPITKAVDLANGSIQKLYAEDTNLNIFQENKVSQALIDKDAIFTAEGKPIRAVSDVVIGNISPYLGKYGISTNPESFAYHGGRKYFADKTRGTIMRLSRDGLTPISDYGMRDWFRDNLKNSTSLYGMYDEQKGHYVLSLQGSGIQGSKVATGLTTTVTKTDYATVAYDEKARGWVSFYTYKPSFGFSLQNNYYTYSGENLYIHYVTDVRRSNFYGAAQSDPSNVSIIFNDMRSTSKNFLTVNYEGSTGWTAEPATKAYSNSTSATTYSAITQEAYKIPQEGVIIPNTAPIQYAGFVKKEGKYFSPIQAKNTDQFYDNSYFQISGLRGHHLEVDLEYWKPNENTPDQGTDKAEIFAVSTEVKN